MSGKKSRNKTVPEVSILSELGIVGCDPVEPVILAALIQQDPLLLVGRHGTGKSFLLSRLSSALGLEHRHYNASLLSFDDLVGYPLPDASGALRYVQTPASIWGAEAVVFDEISRCRPEVQNKLFSIIHERKVQGIALDKLRFRWSAMNPPPAADSAGDYVGSEPLDRALADRFAFVTEFPEWTAFSDEQQEALILTEDGAPPEAVCVRLQSIISRARASLATLRQSLATPLAGYVRMVCSLLHQGQVEITPRRTVMLFRNIVGVHAARSQTCSNPDLADSAVIALTHSLCQRAYGQSVPTLKLMAAHKEAWKSVHLQDGGAFQALLLEPDPIRRFMAAAALPNLSKAEFSTIVADCLERLPHGADSALAVELFESPASGRLVAAVAQQCAFAYGRVCTPQQLNESVPAVSPRHRVWKHVVRKLAELEPNTSETALTHNLMVALFAEKLLETEGDVDGVLQNWLHTRGLIRELRP